MSETEHEAEAAPEPTLSEALKELSNENEQLRERLRESEAKAGKVASLQRAADQAESKLATSEGKLRSLYGDMDDLRSQNDELQRQVRVGGEDAEQIKALKAEIEDKDSQIAALKADFERQATEHNTIQEKLNVATGELDRLGARDAAVNKLLEALDELRNQS
jgi:chromosome segregation ATPase